jgi:uncharacterized protein (DUF433 family)
MSRRPTPGIDAQRVVSRDPEVHSGDLVFAGTRVPVANLIEHLKGGGSIEDFLEGYPTVARWQVERFLDLAADALAHS